MAFGPFKGGGDGSSFESTDPLEQAATKATSAVASQTQAHAKATSQNIVDQFYGNVAVGETADPTANPTQHAAATPQTAASQNGLTPAANPNEQSQLDETRRKLQALQSQHTKSYFDATFGEEAQKKRQQREEEERQLKEQEEEEKRQREEEEKAKMAESMQAFQKGKNGKGPDQLGTPVAVTQAKTRTEINRGSSG